MLTKESRLIIRQKGTVVMRKKINDTSSIRQIHTASQEMVYRSPIPIELRVSDKVDIASYSITVTSNHQDIWIADRKLEINPQGIFQSYIHFCETTGKATFSLEHFTIVIIAHEIGHGLCPIYKKHIQEHDENELNDPYTKIIHEMSAWEHCLPIIPKYIRMEDVLRIAQHSIQYYIKRFLGEKSIPVLMDYFSKKIGQVNQNNEGQVFSNSGSQ